MGNTQPPTPLGKLIVQRMRELGYRQADLAAAADLGPDIISRAITKTGKPEIKTLRALAGALGLDATTLIAFVHGDGGSLTVESTAPALDPDLAETNRLLHQESHLTDAERNELRAIIRRINASYPQRRRRHRPA